MPIFLTPIVEAAEAVQTPRGGGGLDKQAARRGVQPHELQSVYVRRASRGMLATAR